MVTLVPVGTAMRVRSVRVTRARVAMATSVLVAMAMSVRSGRATRVRAGTAMHVPVGTAMHVRRVRVTRDRVGMAMRARRAVSTRIAPRATIASSPIRDRGTTIPTFPMRWCRQTSIASPATS